jgi:ATP-dependent Lhr-like helicase
LQVNSKERGSMELRNELKLLVRKRFGELNEIQNLSIPIILSGANCLVIAPTGYGKTECALLPLLNNIAGGNGIIALYITPLRALNRDVMERIRWWCEELGVSVAVRHGDTSQSERLKQSRNPPQLLITTPETLQSILPAKIIGQALKNVRYVIVDEVHELYESKRGAQLSVALERLLEKTGVEFQRIGLSATVSSPEEAANFLTGGRSCKVVKLQLERKMELRVEFPRPLQEDEELSEKLFLEPHALARLRFLNELIETHTSTLAFVNTRQVAETLTSRLIALRKAQKYEGSVGIHHGSLSKDVRKYTERKFKERGIKGLLATSSLELGIDIGSVDLVVQYMSPKQVSRLIQRVGRSGHGVGRMPKGVVIAGDFDDICESIAIMKMVRERRLEAPPMQSNALDVVAHQLCGLILEYGVVELERAHRIITRAYPFKKLPFSELASVAEQLRYEGIVHAEGNSVKKGGRILTYYFENLSTIPSEGKYFVKNAVTNSNISTLDEAFVASYVEQGSVFITKGVPWRVLDVRDREVIVEPSQDISAAVPDWVGEEIPVPFEVAQAVGELRRKVKEKIERGESVLELEAELDASKDALREMKETVERQMHSSVPDEREILIEVYEDVVVAHVCGGSLANNALMRCLSSLLSSHFSSSVRGSADPYRIVFQLPGSGKRVVKEMLLKMRAEDVVPLLENNISRSSFFNYKFVHIAKAFGLIGKTENITSSRVNRLVGYFSKSPIYRETMRELLVDYFDVERCRLLARKIHSGEVKVHELAVPEPTPFGRLGFSKISRAAEFIAPIEPSSEILKAFRKQLLKKNAKFLCTYCGDIFYSTLEELKRKINCPNCGSNMVACVSPREDWPEKIFRKRAQGKTLHEREKRGFMEVMKSASLVDAYGKRAAVALSTYGVGADTAARVLQNLRREELQFFADLLEAQKRFIRTRRYWQV